jgi:hypothetical protein
MFNRLIRLSVNLLSCIVPYCIILLCVMPNNFTRQGKGHSTGQRGKIYIYKYIYRPFTVGLKMRSCITSEGRFVMNRLLLRRNQRNINELQILSLLGLRQHGICICLYSLVNVWFPS